MDGIISPHRAKPQYVARIGYAGLEEGLDAEIFLKHENHQPIGAFEVRGGVDLVSQLTGRRPSRRGSCVAGACIVAKALAPGVQVIGVRSSAAPTARL